MSEKETKTCAAFKEKYRTKKGVLGEGGWGTVLQVCLHQKCRYAAKIQNFVGQTELERMISGRDIYFLRYLQKSGLVPKLFDYYECIDQTITVMDLYDTNMQTFSEKVAQKYGLAGEGSEIGLFEYDELIEMYKILWKLGFQDGVLFSDAKPDQFLRRSTKNGGFEIVANDFGWASLLPHFKRTDSQINISTQHLGWTSNHESPTEIGMCPSQNEPELTLNFQAALFNIWHMEAFLVAAGLSTPMFVKRGNQIYQFLGTEEFVKLYQTHISYVCPKFVKSFQTITKTWKQRSSYPILRFRFSDFASN